MKLNVYSLFFKPKNIIVDAIRSCLMSLARIMKSISCFSTIDWPKMLEDRGNEVREGRKPWNSLEFVEVKFPIYF